MLHCALDVFLGQCAAASRIHEEVNAVIVAVVSAEQRLQTHKPKSSDRKIAPYFCRSNAVFYRLDLRIPHAFYKNCPHA